MATPPLPSETERLVRYCHPAKILATTRLPGLATLDARAMAALYGVPTARYRELTEAIGREVSAAAERLRRDVDVPAVTGPILALGDSHTDDLGSWAEIVRAVLDARVINAGLSGDTSTAVRARLARLPAATHAFVLVGTNDARRHGDQDMLVSHAETGRNLRAIDHDLRRRYAAVTWITPPPVDQVRVDASRALAEAGVTWRAADVAAKAALVRERWPDAIDLWPVFDSTHLAADGLHPSPAGQRAIARAVLEWLVDRQ